ncbi:MAG: hypothetical protein M0Z46_08925 [Actinomycetota bacterium]|jgi:hypothetical protein|nr:hypothetical protein [Actinomycetota bacterium]
MGAIELKALGAADRLKALGAADWTVRRWMHRGTPPDALVRHSRDCGAGSRAARISSGSRVANTHAISSHRRHGFLDPADAACGAAPCAQRRMGVAPSRARS